jgi:transposase
MQRFGCFQKEDPAMQNSITIIGLDVHKDSIEAAALPPGFDDVQDRQSFGPNRSKLLKWLRRMKRKWGLIEVVYEAGGCGYELYRELTRRGIRCRVAAPSETPRKAGEKRKKTDRIDARKLAILHRAGALTMVSVPDQEDEALRSVMRLRRKLVRDATRTRTQICSHLLRLGQVYRESSNWTNAHWDWLKSLRLPLADEQFTLDRYVEHLEFLESQLGEVEELIRERSRSEEHVDRAARLMALKGINVIAAMVLTAETGDFLRFASARQFMDWVGLVPGVHQSGETRRGLSITKAGNSHCRHMLIQATWSIVRNHPTAGRHLRRRWKGQPAWVTQLSQKAMKRIHRRYWHLMQRGKLKQVAVVAAARELAGFVWAIMQPPEVASNDVQPRRHAQTEVVV